MTDALDAEFKILSIVMEITMEIENGAKRHQLTTKSGTVVIARKPSAFFKFFDFFDIF